MYSPAIQPLVPKAHQTSLQRLNRAIQFSQGQFSIILVNVSSPLMRQWVLDSLRQAVTTEIKELVLHPTVTDLFATVKRSVGRTKSQQVLSVVGLNNLDNLEAALRRMNFERDRFQQEFNFPMIWWIDENVSCKLRRAAPDFSNCLTAPIQFKTEGAELFRMKPTPKMRRAMGATQFAQRGSSKTAIAPRQDTVTYSQPRQLNEIPQLIRVLQLEHTLLVNLELLSDSEAQSSLAQLAEVARNLDGNTQCIGQQLFLFRC